MLKMNVIEPAQSEWASPIVVVPKNDQSPNMYRLLPVKLSFPQR